jgi:pimeloyl-ACP methyl ester carboxylesterase
MHLRYVVAGDGPVVVLLHTLRTQLDMFYRVLPELATQFRVYAIDLPGHGFSDIPSADQTPELFVRAVGGFLDSLNIENAVLAGESIGGAIALVHAARRNPRVRAVVAINPYDYDRGKGIRRSSRLANALFGVNDVPLLGATLTRLRQHAIVRRIIEGGVVNTDSIPAWLDTAIYEVGNRRGHYQGFMSLVHHFPDWERTRDEYAGITCPVSLVYGEKDWSRVEEREEEQRFVPRASLSVVPNAGHFVSLDAPRAFVEAVTRAASA